MKTNKELQTEITMLKRKIKTIEEKNVELKKASEIDDAVIGLDNNESWELVIKLIKSSNLLVEPEPFKGKNHSSQLVYGVPLKESANIADIIVKNL